MIPAWTLAMMESAAPAFTPLDLGSKLKAWWASPEPGVNVTLNGSAIADWTDEVGGYVLAQSSASSQPLYNATGYNGLSCADFDGSNDSLFLDGVPGGIPTGSMPSEVWSACRQDHLGSTGGDKVVLDYGASTISAGRRSLARRPIGGVNRALTGCESTTSINGDVDFSGYQVARGRFNATDHQCDVNGVAGPSIAITLNTDTARIRMGAVTSSTSTAPWLGAIRQVLITEPLTNDEAAQLLSYLNEGP